jgi:hypothetical protein
LLLNPGHEDTAMTLPAAPFAEHWQPLLDTAHHAPLAAEESPASAGSQRLVTAKSVVLLRRV